MYIHMHAYMCVVCVCLSVFAFGFLLMSRIHGHVFLQKYWVMGTRGNRDS